MTYLVVAVAVVQLVTVGLWWIATPKCSYWQLLVAILFAVTADLVAVQTELTDSGLPLVAAGGFGTAVTLQLFRTNHERVTAQLSSHTTLLLVLVGFAASLLVAGDDNGTVVVLAAIATVVAIVVARLTDVLFSFKPMNPNVNRSGNGLIAGWIIGVISGTVLSGIWIASDSPDWTTNLSPIVVGIIISSSAALMGLIVDLGVNFSQQSPKDPASDEDLTVTMDLGTIAQSLAKPRTSFMQRLLIFLGPVLGLATIGPTSYLVNSIIEQW
jgi:hypothetical protein